MWLARTCSGVEYLIQVVVIGALDVGGRYVDLGAQRVDVHDHEADLALLGNLEVGRVRGEMGRHFLIADADLRAETVGQEAHDLQLHFIVAPAILLLEFLVGHREPVGEGRAQFLHREAASDAFLEIGRRQRRTLHAQQLLIALIADEMTVVLKGRNREDALAHFLVAHLDADAPRFGDRRLLVHHLLEDLLLDAQLLEQLLAHVAAVRGSVRLQLRLVGAPEIAGCDRPAFNARDGIAGGGVRGGAAQEVRNIGNDEGQHDNQQAPFEPGPVLAHTIKHRHGVTFETLMLRHELPRWQASHTRPCGIFAVDRSTYVQLCHL